MQDLSTFKPNLTTWLIRTNNYQEIADLIIKEQSSKSVQNHKAILTTNNHIHEWIEKWLMLGYDSLKKDNLAILGEVSINYPSKMNIAKDVQYMLDGLLLKEINPTQNWDIVSLAGARPAQISKLLQQKTGTFLSYMKNRQDFATMDTYLKGKYRGNSSIVFDIKKADILEQLNASNKKFDYIDLDLCCRLDQKISAKIRRSISDVLKSKTIVSVTHTHRGSTYNRIYREEIPFLKEQISSIGSIKEHYHNYYYNTVSTYRETFIIEKE